MNIKKPANEEARLKALLDYNILYTPNEKAFDRLTELACIIFEVNISTISIIADDTQWLKSSVGLEERVTPREDTICTETILDDRLLEITDTRDDNRFNNLPVVIKDPYIRFYAGYPIIDKNGYAMGSMCVMHNTPKKLTVIQRKTLKLLAEEAASLIQERKYLEETRNFEKIFNSSNDLICVANTEGFFKRINPGFVNLLGYEEHQLIENEVLKYVHDEDKLSTRETFNKLSKGASITNFVNRFITINNEVKYIEWLASPDASSNLIYAIGRDITKRYELEQDLLKTKNFLEYTNSLARVGGWEFDLLSNQVYWTDYTKKIHEVADDYTPNIDEGLAFYEEGKVRDEMIEAIENGIRNHTNWDIETQIITAKGNKIWIRSIGVPEIENNECVRLIGAFQDINERKKAEIEFRSTQKLLNDVLNSTSDVSIIATDTNGIITLFNKGAENMLGYKASEIIGKLSPEIIHKPSEIEKRSKYLSKKYNKIINGFETFVVEAEKYGSDQNEWTYISKDGKEFKVSLVATPIKDINNTTIGYLGVAIDISEAYHIRQELIKAKEIAEEASKAKSEFLANMSHEIRTPLNGIIGFSELVLKSNLTPTQNQYLQIVNQSANTLLGLINDVLDFSKIEAGKLELDIDKVDLYEMCNQCVELISFQAQSKGILTLLNIDSDIPQFIWTDNIRLKQVITNLLSNAVKFTSKGEVKIGISLVSKVEDEYELKFKVRDTGIGIHPSKQAKIFEAFSQEDSSTTKRYGGTGLGLSISNQLLMLMGGKLELKSELGVGSEFSFVIKLKAEAYNEEEIINNKRDRLNVYENSDAHILIAEDNTVNTLLVKILIKNILPNAIIYEALNGLEAVEICRTKRVDLIFMDIQMPEMNGYIATEKIRNELKLEIPILALTAGVIKDDIDRCLDAGMNACLSKPVAEKNIYNALKQWLNLGEYVEIKSIENLQSDSIFDREILLKITDGDIELQKEILSTIQTDLIESMNHLGVIAENKDKHRFDSLVHKILGMSKSSGLMKLYSITAKLEKEKNLIELNNVILEEIKSELSKALAIIEEELNK